MNYKTWDWFGYWLVELPHRWWNWRAERFDPLPLLPDLSYRLGSWCYSRGTYAGIRSGALVRNPNYPGEDQPMYVEKSHG